MTIAEFLEHLAKNYDRFRVDTLLTKYHHDDFGGYCCWPVGPDNEIIHNMASRNGPHREAVAYRGEHLWAILGEVIVPGDESLWRQLLEAERDLWIPKEPAGIADTLDDDDSWGDLVRYNIWIFGELGPTNNGE